MSQWDKLLYLGHVKTMKDKYLTIDPCSKVILKSVLRLCSTVIMYPVNFFIFYQLTIFPLLQSRKELKYLMPRDLLYCCWLYLSLYATTELTSTYYLETCGFWWTEFYNFNSSYTGYNLVIIQVCMSMNNPLCAFEHIYLPEYCCKCCIIDTHKCVTWSSASYLFTVTLHNFS